MFQLLRRSKWPLNQNTLLIATSFLVATTTMVGCAQSKNDSSSQMQKTEFVAESAELPVAKDLRPSDFERALQGTLLERVHALDGQKSFINGPNCWNASLMATGFVQNKRFVTKGEFWFWMRSPLCRKKAASAPLKTGDIGSLFYERGEGNYHSFVYLDENTVFSKNSPKAEDEYRIQRYEDMFIDSWKPAATNCKGTQAELAAKSCQFDVVYYECQPIPKNIFAKYPELRPIHKELSSIESDLARMSKRIELTTADEGDRSEKMKQQLEIRIIKLRGLLKDLNKNRSSTERRFIADAIGFRVIGNILTYAETLKTLSPKAQAAIDAALRLDKTGKDKYVPSSVREL